MAEYIEREKAKKMFYNGHTVQSLCERGANTLGEAFSIILDEVPAADVRPLVVAHWKGNICSYCGARVTQSEKYFCCNCGAEMRVTK